MSLIKTIEDQVVFNFTGKINLLVKENGRFIGSVFLKEGQIVNAYYGITSSYESLLCLVFHDHNSKKELRYVVEPEIVDQSRLIFSVEINDLKRKAAEFVTLYQRAESLRPSMNLRIRINPDFLEAGVEPDNYEYKILQTVCDYSLVEDIYKMVELPEYLITLGLVSLREKRALKVCQFK